MKQQFLVDTAETFQTYIYEFNRKLVPSSATLTVYKPGSSTKLLDGVAMTVQSDGRLDYSLTSTDNDIADTNYKAVVAYIVSGTTYYITSFYDVVNSKLHKVITDEDIVNELPQLKDNGWKVRGTADSGSTTTIVDTELKRYEDDYFTGGLAYSIDQDSTKEITDFVSSTGTVTTDTFDSAVSTDKYILTRSYRKEINRAFEKIEELLKRNGKRAELVLDPYDLREVHILYTVAEVCKGLVSNDTDGSMWWEFMDRYDKRAFAVFNALNFKYDTSNDGYVAGSEEIKRMTRTTGRG